MRNLRLLLIIIPLLIFTACGGNDKTEEENIDVEKNQLVALMKMSQNMKE